MFERPSPSPQHGVEWKPSTHQLLIMFTLSVVSFMVALDACIIVTSLSAIVQDLGGTTSQGLWVGTSYLLANAVTMPFLAAIGDIFGRPIILASSVVLFAAGSAICCSARDIGVLIGGRSLQGIGGGGIVILSLVIFTDIVPLRHRPKWYGTVQAAWALGNCIGPLIGGVIAEKTTWRWIFYLMFPFCAFGLVTIPLLLTLKPKKETLGKKLARVDWIGGFIFTSSATTFLIAISWGGTQYAWASVHSLAPLILGVVGLVAVCFWEHFWAREPFLPPSLFKNASAVATFVCGGSQGLLLYGQLYWLPFYFLAVLGHSPIRTGIDLFPVTFTLIPSSIITGVLVTRFNSARYPIWAGWAVVTAGCGVTIALKPGTHTVVWAVALVLLGFGHGSILNAQNFASQAICDSGQEASAAIMYGFLRQFGTAIGVGLGSTIFQNAMKLKLGWEGLSTDLAHEAEAFVPRLLAMPDNAEKRQILDCYMYGLRGVYLGFLSLAATSFLVSLLIKHHDMNKEIETGHVLGSTLLVTLKESKDSSGFPTEEQLVT
ncbi:major facilitator superfamily transporter [Thelonectria olida]|uniref:Major facilitator superfamily transporter n=1 Tax=Thelonectria olida TaxID=1576542 RepID=A0A9P8VPJ3_9HYPO|nr:major facilitator superfamily transporter [Thelonectria olida]